MTTMLLNGGDAARLGLPPWPRALDRLTELNQPVRALAAAYRRWSPTFTPASSATAWPPVTRPSRPPGPPDRAVYCGLIESNAWGASHIRAAFWLALAVADAKQW